MVKYLTFIFVYCVLLIPRICFSQDAVDGTKTEIGDCLGTWEIVTEFSDGLLFFPSGDRVLEFSKDSLIVFEDSEKLEAGSTRFVLKCTETKEKDFVRIKWYAMTDLIENAQRDRHMFNAIMKVSGERAILRMSMDTFTEDNDFLYTEKDEMITKLLTLRRLK